ncbi:prepilin-type N-terminal cleavage/methylation domain-containing protein [Candidatus Peregrinibacteria bacterium]|nr:prepilin-type N-terminal cleavage/methylation domain-containing protein [Candidatus Peregrinibacteria bacterium]
MKLKAFTLIEIIVVITIVSIITSIAVLSYSGAVEKQRANMFAKDLLASAQRARAEVAAGKKTDDKLSCAGLYFELGANPKKVSADYNAAKGRCDFDTEIFTETDQSATDISVDKIEVGGAAISPVTIFFVPPKGDYEVYTEGEELLAGAPVLHFSSAINFGIESGSDRIYVQYDEK